MAYIDSEIPDGPLPDMTDPGDRSSNALDTVNKVLQYWRKKNGINIPGEQEDAPEAQSFDDGGSVEDTPIPEQPDDVPLPQSRPDSAPAIPENGVPADDVRKSLAQDTGVPNTELTGATSEGIPVANTQGVGKGGLKMFMNYLMGNAASPQEAEQAKSESKGDTAAAIAAAGDDPEKATRLLQAYRKSWEARRHAAMAALDHGKMDDAVSLAASGYTDVPNGSDVQFNPSQNGVTAVVSENGKQVGSVPLTTGQFRNWLANGSFDKEVENTPAVTLQQAAKQAFPSATANGGIGKASTMPRMDGQPSTRPTQPLSQEAEQSTQQEETPLEFKTLEQAQRAAAKAFPFAGAGAKSRDEIMRQLLIGGGQKYLSKEREAQIKGESGIERTRAGADGRVIVQDLRNQGNMDVAQERGMHYDKRTDSLANIAGMTDRRLRADELRKYVGDARRAGDSPDMIDKDLKKNGVAGGLASVLGGIQTPQSVPGPQQPSIIPNPSAIQALKQNPAMSAQFDAKYGSGSARRVLGGQ